MMDFIPVKDWDGRLIGKVINYRRVYRPDGEFEIEVSMEMTPEGADLIKGPVRLDHFSVAVAEPVDD